MAGHSEAGAFVLKASKQIAQEDLLPKVPELLHLLHAVDTFPGTGELKGPFLVMPYQFAYTTCLDQSVRTADRPWEILMSFGVLLLIPNSRAPFSLQLELNP